MRCNVAVDADSRALPVIGTGGLAAVRKSARSRWRAAVLIAVHVLVAAHIAHYVMAGRTLSPVEPSESEAWKRHRAKIRNLGPVKAGLQGVRRYGGGMKPDSEATAAYRERLRAAVPFFKTMLYTGSRPSEVLRLVWRDVDLERGVVAVWQEKTGARKTDHVSRAFREVLSGLRRGVGTVPLFVRPDGSSLTKDDVERTFDLAKRMTRLRAELTLYSIRHTFASWLAIQGTPIRTIQELLGHRDLRMTLRYAHLSPAHLREAVEAIGAVEDSNRRHFVATSGDAAEAVDGAKSFEESWWLQRARVGISSSSLSAILRACERRRALRGGLLDKSDSPRGVMRLIREASIMPQVMTDPPDGAGAVEPVPPSLRAVGAVSRIPRMAGGSPNTDGGAILRGSS